MKKIEDLEKYLHLNFKNKDLIIQCLTHKSFVYEHLPAYGEVADTPRLCRRSASAGKPETRDDSRNFFSNERLEFLGDSILNMLVTRYLYFHLPHLEEGQLSKLKSYIVSQQTLLRWAQKIKLGDYLFIGKGEESSGGRTRPSILADALEALIGGIFLDKDLEVVNKFILHFLEEETFLKKSNYLVDYKTALQEKIQSKFKRLPMYHLVRETGPDHQKTFEIEVSLGQKVLGRGKGKSKKEAEQAAAKIAFKNLK